MKLYVGNLDFNTSEQDLVNAFSQYGEVVSVNLIYDRDTGRPRGFGFVEMGSRSDAIKAISGLNETQIGSREIRVNEAQEKTGGFRKERSRY